MKTLIVVLAVVSILLLLSTLICGLWIRFSGNVVDKSSLDFHLWIAIGAVVASVVTLILAMTQN
jgi:hypothetical protein